MLVDFDRQVLSRVPLAEAVLSLWHWVTAPVVLNDLFARHRGQCYERVLSFPLMVDLLADALLQHRGSGRQSFRRAQENDELPASLPAVYQKLGRMPVALSEAFLAEGTQRLRAVFPETLDDPIPKSLQGFTCVVLDGKVVKGVPRRLKALLHAKGGVLGGKALVAMDLASGLAIAMANDADGDVNDAKLVPAVLAQLDSVVTGPRLYIADRQFCDLRQAAAFTADGNHYVVRYHPKTHFCPDPQRPACSGRDRYGRAVTESWGWLGREGNRNRRYVRRIELQRPGEETLVLITDLLVAADYPADDLLEAYLARWGIERVFQKITEVFHLQTLIGTTPEGTLFQLSFCLLLYNMIRVVTAYVAAGARRPMSTVSTELLFVDVRRDLIALTEMLEVRQIVPLIGEFPTAGALRDHLAQLLGSVWTDLWAKAPNKKRQPRPDHKKSYGNHSSAYRLLRDYRKKIKESSGG